MSFRHHRHYRNYRHHRWYKWYHKNIHRHYHGGVQIIKQNYGWYILIGMIIIAVVLWIKL